MKQKESEVAPKAESYSPDSLQALFSDAKVANSLREVSPTSFDVASDFWRAPFKSPHLTLRMKELILLAMHASATALNVDAIKRHVKRARAAGASKEDIVDVLVSIIGLANHALYFSVPILEEELGGKIGSNQDEGPADAKFEAAKQNFIKIRRFWNADRDALARLIPDYFTALMNLSTETWQRGSLSRKERELICIGIDCSVTHTYGPGLRIHIRNAIECGATRDEILEVFQIAALLGLEGYVMAGEALFAESEQT